MRDFVQKILSVFVDKYTKGLVGKQVTLYGVMYVDCSSLSTMNKYSCLSIGFGFGNICIYDSVIRGSCTRCFCIQRTSFGISYRVWISYIVGYTYHIPYTAYRITYQPPYQYDTPTPDIIIYYLPHPPILGTYPRCYII